MSRCSTARRASRRRRALATERGTLDRLQCERFSIWFRRDPESPSSGDPVQGRPPIEIVRVLAEGNPGRVVTSGVAGSAASSQAPRWHELTGPKLEYVVDAASQTPWLQAAGPGRYETGTAGQKGDRFQAAWTDALRWKPDGQQSEISRCWETSFVKQDVSAVLPPEACGMWLRDNRPPGAPQAESAPSDVPRGRHGGWSLGRICGSGTRQPAAGAPPRRAECAVLTGPADRPHPAAGRRLRGTVGSNDPDGGIHRYRSTARCRHCRFTRRAPSRGQRSYYCARRSAGRHLPRSRTAARRSRPLPAARRRTRHRARSISAGGSVARVN